MTLRIQFKDIETANKYKETFEKLDIDNTIDFRTITIYKVTRYEDFREREHIWFMSNEQVVFIDDYLIRDIYIFAK